jgi:glycosyltransferase involved in cell wall biosynthesis
MSQDLISVIIPVYNAEKYLSEAINSVLAQSHTDLEIIAVDDGSTDSSTEILHSYGRHVKALRQENAGAAAARNAGIAACTGDYISFLDADDYWHPDKLQLQLSLLRSDCGLSSVFTLLKHFICPTVEASESRNVYCPEEAQPGYIAGTLLAHRRVINQVGMFNTQYRLGEFIDWQLRANAMGIRNALLGKEMYYRRLHQKNLTKNNDASKKDYARVAHAALMRKKSA